MAQKDEARGDDSATVEVPPTEPRFLFIRCSQCAAEVDRVEWDAAVTEPPAVSQVRASLGVDEKAARKMLAEHNPDALKLPEQAAKELADSIAAEDVPERDAETYACPRGHTAGLEVTER